MNIDNSDGEPFNDSRIRWKILIVNDYEKEFPYLYSHFSKDKWRVGKRHTATNRAGTAVVYKTPSDIGFHVFVNKANAVAAGEIFDGAVIVKLKVAGFNDSGRWGSRDCETWR